MQTKSGRPIFPVGIGTWNIEGSFSPDPEAQYKGAVPNYDNETEEIAAIRHSLSRGQNHIDCAQLYGAFHTDEVVGKALAGCSRQDLFIADKLWKTSVGEGRVRPTVMKMLEKLGTDYLDILYIHAPWADVNWQEAIPQIDALIDEGIVRYFGVSNFTVEQMQQVQAIAEHPIAMAQMNYNVLYKTEVDDSFKEFCAQHDIRIVAYQPVKRTEVLENDVVQVVAQKYGVTPAQVALAWLIAQNALPIPKAVSIDHIDENVAAASLRLYQEDLELLSAI